MLIDRGMHKDVVHICNRILHAQSLSCVQLFKIPWTVACRLLCHKILQARILEWVVISSFRGSSWPRDQTPIHCIASTGRQILYCLGLHGGSDGKESACNLGDPGLIPRYGRSPEEGNDNLLQYSCLENPMNGGVYSQRGCKESDTTEQLTLKPLTLSLLYHLSHLRSPTMNITKKNKIMPFAET